MTTTIVITRGGVGDILRFDSFDEADEHPLYTPGDAIMCSAEDVREQYNTLQRPRLLERVCEDGGTRFNNCLTSGDGATAWTILWEGLKRVAEAPTTDPSEIVKMVVRDRRATREGVRTMSDAKEETKSPIGNAKFKDDQVVKAGTDKDGNEYGAENNPKRAGTKAHDRFSLYKFGDTVKANKEAGVTVADINYDADKGFIVVE